MTTLVVDASVAVKWIFDEQGSEAARELLMKSKFHAPDLLMAEVANTLWSRQRRGALPREVADGFYAVIGGLGISMTPMAQLLDRARAISSVLDLTIFDSVYVALAERLSLPLATADAGIVRAVERHAWPVVLERIGL